MDGYYPLTGIVTEVESVDSETDLITITCANGNMFSWYSDASDCWELYDFASCIMDANDTKYVYDDEVVLAIMVVDLNISYSIQGRTNYEI